MRRWTGIALAVYMVVVLIGTLIPFRFEKPDPWRADPEWRPPDGMVFDGMGMFSLPRAVPAIADSIEAAGALYLYLEVRPDARRQYGPARIFSYSVYERYQALMVAQSGGRLVVRLAPAEFEARRWTGQEYAFADGLAANDWNAILILVDRTALTVYRDGRLLGRHTDHAFSPGTWLRECRLVAGNEATGVRPWRGSIRRVELGAGPPPARVLHEAGVSRPETETIGGDPHSVVLFDLSAAPERVPTGWHGHRTSAYGRRILTPISLRPFSEPHDKQWARSDWVRNFFLLMPMGFLLRLRGRGWPAILALCFGFSLLIEVTQLFIPLRHTQSTDLILNGVGGFIGGLVATGLGRVIAARRAVRP